MYDRKTWIVVSLCAVMIGANIFITSKNQTQIAKEEAEKQAQVEAAKPTPAEVAAAAPDAGLTVDPPPPPTEETLVTLENDQMVFTLTNIGGGVKYAEFKNQFEVGSNTARVRINRFASGPIGAFSDASRNLESAVYTYKPELSIPGKKAVYVGNLNSGLIAKKTYTLEEDPAPGSPYLLNFDLALENTSADSINLKQWSIFAGEASPLYEAEVAQQTGFFWRENGSIHFEHVGEFKEGFMGFKAAKPIITSPADKTVEYAGVTDQFFSTVLRPKNPYTASVWAKSAPINLTEGGRELHSVSAGLDLPAATLASNEQKSFSYRIFIGPKNNSMLRKMDNHWGDGWGDLMQYGWFGVVSRTLNWVLNKLHLIFNKVSTNWSWGLSIIFLTIIVRGCIWPLHAKSTRTMKRMSKLQPEIAKLKEKYPDDPNKLNQEMMGLYRKFGINPLGGCLPMVIQIPVFFGFYKMLQYAVELRHQGFMWVPDLSQPYTLFTIHLPFALPILGANLPINPLPILMGITSFVQIAMTPRTGDKAQQRIVMFMPLMFFFFCYNFASALALYWTTQNLFSIGQTWLMNKIPEPELKARKDGGSKSWVQKMAERQAELQKVKSAGGNMRDVTPEKKKPRGPRTGG
ncbi:membrane protein insertase YidC [Luteolibacter pohnpeiensis]|uniref:Membrane protein insertase YidC n=1 Tax=Luteolibacter pohnpeiensis TaxID=454153 RepID=A0A934SDQ4_9BACT|nr:membrane protein insertase YidC [Luteolibacter pohnpeiensis]MBK1883989.1 membrane protein insertase YidC [Luteolibacter pohnpeiensis]